MIGVVGLGFVGLTTALGLAHQGHKVYGFDSAKARLDDLNQGRVPFHEPHLEEYLNEYRNKRFVLCQDLKELIQKSKVIFLLDLSTCLPI